MSVKLVDIVFDGPPSHKSGRFVEVEDQDGKSIRAGKWIHRSDGYWALQLEIETSDESNDSPGVKAIADERTRQIKKGYSRTFAQSLAALLTADGLGVTDVAWPSALSVAGMAGLLSALTIWAQGQAWLAEPRVPGRHEAE